LKEFSSHAQGTVTELSVPKREIEGQALVGKFKNVEIANRLTLYSRLYNFVKELKNGVILGVILTKTHKILCRVLMVLRSNIKYPKVQD